MTAKPPSASTLSPETSIETTAKVTFDEVRDANGDLVEKDDVTFDKTLTIKGTAASNTVLNLRDSFRILYEVTSRNDGSWVNQLTLSDFKRYSLSVIEKAGDRDFSNPPNTFVLATETPIIEKVTGNGDKIEDGGTYDGDSLEFSGYAPPDMEVEAFNGDTPTGKKATVDPDGLFTLTLDGLTAGSYNIKIRAANGKESDEFTFKVVFDVALSLDEVTDSKGPILEGGTTYENKVTVNGFARPGEEVQLLNNGSPISDATDTAEDDGAWEIIIDVTPDSYSLTARALGEVTAPPYTFIVAQDVKLSLDDVKDSKGTIAEGGTTDEVKVTVSGHARPGEAVQLRNNDTPIVGATAPASDDDGSWEIELDVTPDDYSLTVEALYGDGEISTPPRTFTVALHVELSLDEVTDSKGPILEGGTTYENKVTVNGFARPGEEVQLLNNGSPISGATDTAEDDGAWEIIIDVTPASYSLTARALGEETPPYTFIVAQDVKLSLDDVKDSRGTIAVGGTTYEEKVTVSGYARRGEEVRLRNNDTPIVDATTPASGDDGFWEIELDVTPNPYSLTVEALYGDGEISIPPRTFNVETAVTPTISAIEGAFGPIDPNTTTIETAVTVKGRASKNQNIEIWNGAERLAVAQVDPSGSFSKGISGLTAKTYNLRIKPLYGTGVPDSAIRSFTVIDWPDSVTTFNDGTIGGWQRGIAFTQSVVAEGVLRNTTTALSGHAGVVLSKAFVFDANEKYSLTFRVRNFSTQTASLTPKFSATMTTSPNEQVLIPVFDVPKDGQWHFLEAQFTVPRTNNYTLNIKSNENRGGGSGADGGNDYELDDIIVRQIRPEWSDSITDFNDGSLGSWTQGITAKGAEIINGVFRNETKRLTGNAGIVLLKNFRFEKDRTYLFSYRVRNFSGEAANKPPRLSVSSGGSTILPEYSIPRDGTWYTRQGEFSVPTTNDSIRININSHEDRGGGSGSDGGNDYEIDDIVVLKLR
ncbi:carboxypeptidase regulatory-like domain-containing protein [Pseudomonas sp. GM48]|uniref:carboxypeptidase regulatory-like domain-containing protein n=1 Tax=Pseudomonas sp. GM48 TaxID=1144330 RepID=UPI00026FDD60|nr:carboxypeptidase regulatory-like domain-containing protein [Pseudomonas sp. GM48]EJM60100.1 hypothetical protein PMI28_01412 [Pseudomonas sp. GM48]